MFRLIVARMLQLPLILAVIFTTTFLLVWVIPGNPLDQPEGRRPDKEIQAAMLRQYNLDNPWRFAGQYLRDVVTKGDFGPSLRYQDQRVSSIIREGLPVSATIGVAALIVALFLGLFAGVVGALYPRTPLDMASLTLALVGVSLPTFVTGSVLLAIFAAVARLAGWDILVIGAWEWPTPSSHWPFFDAAWRSTAGDFLARIALPAFTLGLAPAAYIASLMRFGLAEVMRGDFVRTARAKGLSEFRVVQRHAIKVAFLPVLSFLGPAAAVTLTGSFIVERVFNIPGIGDHFVQAVLNKDQFLILGVVLVYSTMLIVFNLLVDIAYAWVDPRIELT